MARIWPYFKRILLMGVGAAVCFAGAMLAVSGLFAIGPSLEMQTLFWALIIGGGALALGGFSLFIYQTVLLIRLIAGAA